MATQDTSRRFQDQVVLITGATSGIGLEMARIFTAQGARVIGTGRDQERLAELGKTIELALTMDVTDARSVEIACAAIRDRFEHVDVLVNNAGVGLWCDAIETTIRDARRVMDINFFGAMAVTEQLLGDMLARGRGTIVNISSITGLRGYGRLSAYCASKHALTGWSRALRAELEDKGIRVVIVSPPAVDTPFFENANYSEMKKDHPRLKLLTARQVAEQSVDAAFTGERNRLMDSRSKILFAIHNLAPSLLEGMQKIKMATVGH